MDRGAWWAAVHGVAKSRARLSDFTFTFHFHALEKEMATHSSILAWRIPGTEEPSGLPSLGSHRVGHNWSDLAATAAAAAATPIKIVLHHYLVHTDTWIKLKKNILWNNETFHQTSLCMMSQCLFFYLIFRKYWLQSPNWFYDPLDGW